MNIARALCPFGLVLLSIASGGCVASEGTSETSSARSSDSMPEWTRTAVGFDSIATSPGSAMLDGWRQLFRVTLEDGERVRTWWLRVDVPKDPLPSTQSMSITMTIDGVAETIETRMTTVSLWLQEVGDQNANVSLVELPLRSSEQGMFDLCQLYIALPASDSSSTATLELTREQKLLYGSCASSLVAMLRVVQGNDGLSKVLWSVVEKPNWVGVLFRGGNVSLSISPQFENATVVPSELPEPIDSIPAARYPMYVDVNGNRALDCEITVCPPAPPLHVLGGIVRLVGTHPSRHERRVTIDVVGARGPSTVIATGN